VQSLRFPFVVIALAYASTSIAQQGPKALEPLPTDPRKRIYYGEHYDPGEYAKCWEKWIKTGDPRGVFCEKYRERLEPLDPKRRNEFGEFYDPKKYHECRARVEARDTQCEYLKLRRNESAEYWPYSTVLAPKLPDPPNPPVYKRGMKAKEYFQALCKAEAGEFIYRTVENVESVYQVRPRRSASTAAIRDRYVMEDPYGYTDAEARTPPMIFLGPKKYHYFEVPATSRIGEGSSDVVARFFGYDDKNPKSLQREYDSKLKSRYGYTWRGIRRPHDRENAIAGGELIVLDLQTNEILGIRRGFILSGNVRNVHTGIQWEIGSVCPRLTDRPRWPKDFDFSYWFVSKVLKPSGSIGRGEDGTERK
jgi:hypothetical protein